jgi:hypothetical protein
MTKITMDETPSQQATAKASAEVKINDSTGREITLKKAGILAQYRLIEALGDTAKNETYLAMCLPLIYVTDIAGEHVVFPTSKFLVEALITRLGDEGVEAVMFGVRNHFGVQDPEADKAAIKK